MKAGTFGQANYFHYLKVLAGNIIDQSKKGPDPHCGCAITVTIHVHAWHQGDGTRVGLLFGTLAEMPIHDVINVYVVNEQPQHFIH